MGVDFTEPGHSIERFVGTDRCYSAVTRLLFPSLGAVESLSPRTLEPLFLGDCLCVAPLPQNVLFSVLSFLKCASLIPFGL